MRIRRPKSAATLFRDLETLAFGEDDYIFRGHADTNWRVSSTLNRFSTSRLPEYKGMEIESLIAKFRNRMVRMGHREMLDMTTRGQLEYSRHCGVPTPLIDFTRSPYVAAWFAFHDSYERGTSGSCAIYALNMMRFGLAYNDMVTRKFSNQRNFATGKSYFDTFRWDQNADYFDHGYPIPDLKFLSQSASTNIKMYRQMGCFIYDSWNYHDEEFEDLEGMILNESGFLNVSENLGPIVEKFVLSRSMARQIMPRLNRMGISGAFLFDNDYGAVMDVRNVFSDGAYGWDLPSSWGE